MKRFIGLAFESIVLGLCAIGVILDWLDRREAKRLDRG